MLKIKILRNFYVGSKLYSQNEELMVDDGFAGSPRYYKLISASSDKKTKTSQKKRKRIPNRAVKSRNTAITNKDKK